MSIFGFSKRGNSSGSSNSGGRPRTGRGSSTKSGKDSQRDPFQEGFDAGRTFERAQQEREQKSQRKQDHRCSSCGASYHIRTGSKAGFRCECGNVETD